jgi:GTP pyrophosphokinase
MSEIAEFTKHLGHYLPQKDVALVKSAFEFSESAHRGQFRKSGEPYITHPLAVASILSQWRLDAQGLAAALPARRDGGHLRHQERAREELRQAVADMVDGVSKLDQIEFTSKEEVQAESFRKMLLAMARDVRVILIKLADRLHNMRTLDAMAPAHRKRIAKETIDIYAPIANRLGLNSLFLELQDLSFKQLNPMRYRILAAAIKAARGNRREVMNRLLDVIAKGLAKENVLAVVSGREKTIYSVYKKMREKRYTFAQVFDIYGVRILVADKTNCYAALGVLHELYKPIPGKFKDYVAIRRPNGYQSLHTTLFGRSARRSKCRSARTTCTASPRPAWPRTGCTRRAASSISRKRSAKRRDGCRASSRSSPIRRIRRNSSSTSRATSSRRDLRVHAQGKDHGAAARRHGGRLRLRRSHRHRPSLRRRAHQLRAAAAAHRAQERRPRRDPHVADRAPESFVAVVRARRARRARASAITSRGLQQKESAALGERLLNQALATLKVEPDAISWDRWEALAKEYGAKSQLDILADIGLGKRLSFVVAQALTKVPGKTEEPAPQASPAKLGSLSLRGVEGVAIQYGKCCRPIPGDSIVGQFRRNQGLLVHTRDCLTLKKQHLEATELVDVEWAADVQGVFEAGIRLLVADRRGLLAELAMAIADADANIDTVSMERPDGDEVLAMFFGVQVRDRRHLAQVLRSLRRIPDVRRAQRART